LNRTGPKQGRTPAGPFARPGAAAVKMRALKVIAGTVRRLKRESGRAAGLFARTVRALKPELPPQR